jgi:hypothetical protein
LQTDRIRPVDDDDRDGGEFGAVEYAISKDDWEAGAEGLR